MRKILSLLVTGCLMIFMLCGCGRDAEVSEGMQQTHGTQPSHSSQHSQPTQPTQSKAPKYLLTKEVQTLTVHKGNEDETEQVYSIDNQYDSEGFLIKSTYTYKTGDVEVTEYEWNDKGYISYEKIFKNGNLGLEYRYTYDEKGNKQTANKSSGGVTTVISWTYDDQGRVMTESEDLDSCMNGTVYSYDDLNHTAIKTTYQLGNVLQTEETVRDNQGRLLSVTTFDNTGKRVASTEYKHEGSTTTVLSYKFSHTSNGEFRTESSQGHFMYIYDETGRLSKEQHFRNVRMTEGEVTREGIMLLAVTDYSYDASGNLIRTVQMKYYPKKTYFSEYCIFSDGTVKEARIFETYVMDYSYQTVS